MGFDNSFDYQDLYPPGSDERDYYDDMWYSNERDFEQERRDYEEEKRRQEGRPSSEPLFNRYNNSPSKIAGSIPRNDGYGHGVQEEQIDQNDDDMSQLGNIGPNRPNPFNLFRTSINDSNWF